MNYQIGPWLFTVNRCLLSSGNIERELDPLLVKLILHFIEQPQSIVSRQQLIEQVWQQSFVDDNAINRAMSELRKQLAHPIEKAPLIKTHYRKGYSLTVIPVAIDATDNTFPKSNSSNSDVFNEDLATEPKPLDSTASPSAPSNVSVEPQVQTTSPAKHSVWKRAGLYGLVALAVVIFAIFVWHQTSREINTQQKTEATLIPTTWNVGAESTPALSFDKQLLAYSNFDPTQDRYRVFVKDLVSQQDVELTYQDLNVSVLAWQQQQRTLLLQATKIDQQQCLIVSIDLTSFPKLAQSKVVKECDFRYTGYAQLDQQGQYLYFTEYKDKLAGSGLYRYNLENGTETTLVPQSEVLFGVLLPRLSPSGQYISYILSQQGQPFSVYLYNVKSAETKRVFSAKEKTVSFAYDWIPASNQLMIAEQDIVSIIDVTSQSIQQHQLIPAIAPLYLAAQTANSFYFSPTKTQQLAITQVTNAFSDDVSATPLFSSQGDNYSALALDDKQTLFISDRSGTSQLWLNEGTKQSQLSQFKSDLGEAFFGFLRVNKAQNFVLFTKQNKLVFFDLATRKLHDLPELVDFNVTSYAWSKNSEAIWFIDQTEKSYQLWQFNLLTRELTKHKDVVAIALVSDLHGESYAISNTQLTRLEDGKSWDVPPPLNMAIFHAVNRDYLYFSDGISRIARLNLVTNELEQAKLNFKSATFSVNDKNELLFSQRSFKDTQIKHVEW